MEFQFQFDWQAAIDSIPFLIKGIPYTLLISFGGLLIGFALGIFFGLLSINKKWFLRWPATAYIEIFRGTPILVQVLFIFYGLPDLIGGPIDPLTAGIAAIALNSGAYIRGGPRWRAVHRQGPDRSRAIPWPFPHPDVLVCGLATGVPPHDSATGQPGHCQPSRTPLCSQ